MSCERVDVIRTVLALVASACIAGVAVVTATPPPPIQPTLKAPMTTAYFQRQPKIIQDRLTPLLPVLEKASRANNIPLDLLLSVAIEESAGRQDLVGDTDQANPAIGMWQARDKKWTGGADPRDAAASAPGIAKNLSKLYAECGNDPACVHFRYMSGPNRDYTPEGQAKHAAKFPHLASRMERVRQQLAPSPEPMPPAAPAATLLGGEPAFSTPPAPAFDQRPVMQNDPRRADAAQVRMQQQQVQATTIPTQQPFSAPVDQQASAMLGLNDWRSHTPVIPVNDGMDVDPVRFGANRFFGLA